MLSQLSYFPGGAFTQAWVYLLRAALSTGFFLPDQLAASGMIWM